MTESQSLSPSKLSHQRLFCVCWRAGRYNTKPVCRKLGAPVLSFMGPSLFPVQTNQAKVLELPPGDQNATMDSPQENLRCCFYRSRLLFTVFVGSWGQGLGSQFMQRLRGSSWPSSHGLSHTCLILLQTLVKKFQRNAMCQGGGLLI